jgi:hypothetical protein
MQLLFSHAKGIKLPCGGKKLLLQLRAVGILCPAPCHKAALSGDGNYVALALQLTVCPLYGVGVDGKLHGKLTHGGQLVVLAQKSLENLALDSLDAEKSLG